MPYLGVSHLALRKTDSKAAGVKLNVWIFSKNAVKHRSIGCFYCIARLGWIQAITVKNHQYCRLMFYFSHNEYLISFKM